MEGIHWVIKFTKLQFQFSPVYAAGAVLAVVMIASLLSSGIASGNMSLHYQSVDMGLRDVPGSIFLSAPATLHRASHVEIIIQPQSTRLIPRSTSGFFNSHNTSDRRDAVGSQMLFNACKILYLSPVASTPLPIRMCFATGTTGFTISSPRHARHGQSV